MNIRKVLINLIFLSCFFITSSILSENFKWSPKGDEPAFSLDVPADWESDYVVKGNGSIVFFRNDDAVIEVRSFIADDDFEHIDLINLKAARLSSQYTHVKLLYEKASRYRKKLYLAAWQLTHKGKRYIEKSGFIVDGEMVLVISCISPAYSYKKQKTIFDNALLSFQIEDFDDKSGNEILKLKTLFVFNRPNSVQKLAPPKAVSFMNKTSKSTKSKKKSSKTTRKKKSGKDSFLPPAK